MSVPVPPLDELLPIRWSGRRVLLSVRFRPGGDDLLVCLHGFGCAKECFDAAFAAAPLAGLSIVGVDFPGHGSSGPLPPTTDPIQTYADLTANLVRRLARGRVFLVCHGMGGAAGLLASAELPRLDGLIHIEGDLVGEGCGMVSRRAAEAPLPEFLRWEYPKFQARLAASPRPDLRAWGGWYARADPITLHQLARSLVEWADSGKLIDMLTSLGSSAYVFGQDNQAALDHRLSSLPGVAAYPIAGSAGFPMLDNPTDLWRTVADAVAGW